ncbi:response regulator transcription factor [Parafrankia sp. FMc6]|uniref:response regulator transcription factor n=1 Tax=Parafrankia soli TaxID=2599596 RepID=UPI0034D4C1EF
MTTGPSDGDAPVRVLVVDDDALVRSALAMMFDGADGARIVGEATDGDEVAAAVDALRPDVVLMDIRMARMDGLRATELLLARDQPPQVVVLTTFDADDQVLRALRTGASGFLLKDTPPAEIVRAVLRVAAGEPMLSPTVTRQLIARIAAVEAAPPPATPPPPVAAQAVAAERSAARRTAARRAVAQLSAREREVALAVGRGLSNAEIAGELFMSVATAKSYVSRLLTKLDLSNRVQLALLVHDAEEPAG